MMSFRSQSIIEKQIVLGSKEMKVTLLLIKLVRSLDTANCLYHMLHTHTRRVRDIPGRFETKQDPVGLLGAGTFLSSLPDLR